MYLKWRLVFILIILSSQIGCSKFTVPISLQDHSGEAENSSTDSISDSDSQLQGLPSQISGRTPNFKVGALPYGSGYVDEASQKMIAQWLAQRFDFTIGGTNPLPYNPNMLYAKYFDISGGYSGNPKAISDITQVKDFAESQNWKFEDMLVHMKVNFDSVIGRKDVEKFDHFEGANGVLVEDGVQLIDKTSVAYTVGPIILKNNLYIGYEEPFDEINITLSTPNSSIEGQWQYWNGVSWVPHQKITDGTNLFKQNGQIKISPAADWKRKVIGTSRNKWFVRFNKTSAATATITKIWGDNWVLGGPTKNRGWDPTSPSIINKGTELEYNPTPPETALARFRYQSRVTGIWGINYFMYNPADFQNGRRTASENAARVALLTMRTSKTNAIMFDVVNVSIGGAVTAPSNPTDFSDFADLSTSWPTSLCERYAEAKRLIKMEMPTAVVGANTGLLKSLVEIGDWMLAEYYQDRVTATLGHRLITTTDIPNDKFITYDQFAPANNPKGVLGLFIYADLFSYYNENGRAFPWDRRQRGPMVALSKHYIAMNENTVFIYYTEGGFRYDSSDEVLYYNASTTLSNALTTDTTSALKTLNGDFTNLKDIGYIKGYYEVKIKDYVLRINKVNNTTITTYAPIAENLPAGTTIQFITSAHRSMETHPDYDMIHSWHYYFPAMDVNIGIPDTSGFNNGQYSLTWVLGSNLDKGPDIWRRDYTKAIVLHRPAAPSTPVSYMTTYSPEIPLGGIYYPLQTNGITAEPIDKIALRAGEGVILMKQPITAQP